MSLSEPLLPLRPNFRGGGLCVQSSTQEYQQQECRTFQGDCDLFPPPLILNLGHRRGGPACSFWSLLPTSTCILPLAFPAGSQACMRGGCVTRSFPPAFSISCFSFPHTMISPAQCSLALAALMHALPGSPFSGLHLLQGSNP